jgi:predicted O-methyltransferase YrrM
LEFTALLLLFKRANARRIFEFGTFKGISITQMALNLPPESEIYTLDLPDESLNTQFANEPEDAAIAGETGKGSLVPAELRPRIRFLKSDSAKFDETPFAGKMDFVFVDGAHNIDYVKNDSEKGWRMLRPGGIIGIPASCATWCKAPSSPHGSPEPPLPSRPSRDGSPVALQVFPVAA